MHKRKFSDIGLLLWHLTWQLRDEREKYNAYAGKKRVTLWPCHTQEAFSLMEMLVPFREKIVFLKGFFPRPLVVTYNYYILGNTNVLKTQQMYSLEVIL